MWKNNTRSLMKYTKRSAESQLFHWEWKLAYSKHVEQNSLYSVRAKYTRYSTLKRSTLPS